MRLGVHESLRKAGQWLKKNLTPTGIVLLYHRIAEVSSDPQLLAVKPQHFAEHLEILKKTCSPVSLKDLMPALQERIPPPHPMAITFDDGYADNLAYAKPLAERYGIPMTVFVTTGYVGSNREFWWDDLERLILKPVRLPDRLELDNLQGRTFTWQLSNGDGYNGDDYESWSVECPDNPTPRHALYRSLCRVLRPLTEEKRREVLDTLLIWAGANAAGRLTHLALTADELVRLDRGRLVEVGAHTSTHAFLSALSKTEQAAEIQGSKLALEEILRHPVKSFAYPFGSRGDYNTETVELVRHAGFELACANFSDIVWGRSDCFQLPRLLVRDWNGETFERWLRGWIGG
jgi:peptidoglycan/xylan/chitin deacetylase (PgdA/CDA1 family)